MQSIAEYVQRSESFVTSCRSNIRQWVRADSGALPIAMMHYVARPPVRSRHRALFLAPAAFRTFLELLRLEGAKTVSPDRYSTLRESNTPELSITFDDGSADLIENALPALRDSGLQSTVFLVYEGIGGWNEWDIVTGDAPVRLADAIQIREWLSEGQRIGAHGLTHRSLLRMSLEEARREIQDSKKRLEDRFGVPIHDFCYPYGAVNERVRDLVAEAGYRTACSTRLGVNLPSEDAFLLRRTPVQHRRAWLAAVCPSFLARCC